MMVWSIVTVSIDARKDDGEVMGKGESQWGCIGINVHGQVVDKWFDVPRSCPDHDRMCGECWK